MIATVILISNPTPTPTPPPPGAGTAIIADFNGDGHRDFVVRNPATRQTAIWHLNNNVLIGGVLGPTLPAGWGLGGEAACNRDSRVDYGFFLSRFRHSASLFVLRSTFM